MSAGSSRMFEHCGKDTTQIAICGDCSGTHLGGEVMSTWSPVIGRHCSLSCWPPFLTQLLAAIARSAVGRHCSLSCWPPFLAQLLASIAHSAVGRHCSLSCWPPLLTQLLAAISRSAVGRHFSLSCWPPLLALLLASIAHSLRLSCCCQYVTSHSY